jgi:predicted dehydrogenase
MTGPDQRGDPGGSAPQGKNSQVRWGVLGTARIAVSSFLPALRQAGGIPAVVAGRDLDRARRYATANGIDRAVVGYQALVEDDQVEAIYIPLPNSLHAQWTIAALQAGKPVLCEKPLCGTLADTERVLAIATQTGTPLWEAFVFPFQRQHEQLLDALASGEVGELREIQSGFHFKLGRDDDIRMFPALEGGALNDVGCYPLRLAAELFGAPHEGFWSDAVFGGHGVDVESWGALRYPGGRRLLFSCGMRRGPDTFTRLICSEGEIRVSNPFHPRQGDQFRVLRAGHEPRIVHASAEPSFTDAIRHIQQVVRGAAQPRQLAVDHTQPTARALHDLQSCWQRPAGSAADGTQ